MKVIVGILAIILITVAYKSFIAPTVQQKTVMVGEKKKNVVRKSRTNVCWDDPSWGCTEKCWNYVGNGKCLDWNDWDWNGNKWNWPE